jgi:hypothetical protein
MLTTYFQLMDHCIITLPLLIHLFKNGLKIKSEILNTLNTHTLYNK